MASVNRQASGLLTVLAGMTTGLKVFLSQKARMVGFFFAVIVGPRAG